VPAVQPDASDLVARLDLKLPLIGLYDAPDPGPFAPLVEPRVGRGACLFDFFPRWQAGETLHLTRERFGCGGAGRAFFGVQARERDDFIDFLWKEEGLRATRELMAGWVDNAPHYDPRHEHVLIGPLKPEKAEFLRTVTFWVNPDQFSLLQLGAYNHHAWDEPDPVIVPLGSGCSELVVAFGDRAKPQAAIAGTDIAMRTELPADVLGFTVTVPMFTRLCALGDDSFFGKGFLRRLRTARGAAWRDIREAIRRLGRNRQKLERFHVTHMSVFGSTARDEATFHSDVDLLVEFDPDAPVGLFTFVRLQDYLADVMGCRIDLATPAALRPEMRDQILSEAVHAF
jgi:predicted nucleotidyltransferase